MAVGGSTCLGGQHQQRVRGGTLEAIETNLGTVLSEPPPSCGVGDQGDAGRCERGRKPQKVIVRV